ncbi:restriction endonuclease subunit S [Streptomyces sp. KMM 9044]|uniref:restriction endonuclease subunit S n=1 Tax=Streptomyces sp. KMM 9044 TaxID=2744474 RepID=UPI002150ABF0|nr:restriction endonuclease subunit S [Streptomyces sp. KMM 9044]WAX77031.1 restriction endonuclease subunit S [Streptomyces sp. KMM 9044]
MKGPLWNVLPDGWLAGQVKNAATVTLGKMLQSKDSGSDVRAPYMRAANVQPDGVLALDDVKEMWFGEDELGQLSIRAGDVVVVEGGQGGFGRAAYVDQDLPGWGFQNSINRLRPIGDFDGRFIAFYLIALRASGFIRAYSNVVSMPHLTAEKLARIPIPLPPVGVQRAIADYLDHETARIDTLIEEQQRLIEMLHERRRSVVQHAVAGSDRNDVCQTGDPWWPELPDDWTPVSLRRVLRGLADGPHFSPNYVDDGVMFLSARNVKVDRWSLDDAKFVSEADYLEFSKRVVPEPGDVLYTKGGTTGIARVVDLDFPFQVWVHVAVLKVRHDLVEPSFLAYALNSGPCYDQSQLFTRGATNNDLGLTRIVNIVTPLPPLDEQRRIVAYLDDETAKIGALIAETERFIELSRERRSALITAAVTGQIDVRKAA